MSFISTLTLIVNGFTLVMSLAFLLIILWHNAAKDQNQLLGLFMIAVGSWSVGSLLVLLLSVVNPQAGLFGTALNLMGIGFVSSAIAIYAFTAVTVGVLTRRFKFLIIVSWALLLAYQFLITQLDISVVTQQPESLHFGNVPSAFYLIFTVATVYLCWRYRVRIASPVLQGGILLFVFGQVIGLLNPQFQTLSLSVMVSSVAALVIGLSILRQEIIMPLAKRTAQAEAMHTMSLAITSQLSIQVILDQIATQTRNRLDADGVGVFLREGNAIRLAAVDGLPAALLNTVLPSEAGVVGHVIDHKETVQLENYERDWKGSHDIPFAAAAFGALICVPLVYAETAIGAIMIVAGKRKHAFLPDDTHLLAMLGAQAAVAIKHGQLFTQQNFLTEEIAEARNQLETLLASTENPVIAVNRKLEMIFANTAAERLVPSIKYMQQPVTEILPGKMLPTGFLNVYRDIKKKRVHMYEIAMGDRVYMSHIAALGRENAIQGWVAVLNDVTQLKELDRLKSEMVRMTSHDLKNPLQAALANLDLLADSDIAETDEDVAYSVKVIEKNLNRMYRIISGVLDVERVRAESRSLGVCHLVHIIERAVEDLRDTAEGKQIRLTCDVPQDLPAVQGDSQQLEQAFANLIENAIKFTSTGGCVSIRAVQDLKHVQFEIEDTGIGIPADKQANVFDSFFRANQKGAEHITGTGLGLHLVKTIIENHDGRVWLESEENIGTTFYVSIPISVKVIV